MVRAVTKADYPAMAEVWGAAYPDDPRSAVDFRLKEERSAEAFGRLVAEADGRLVGFGQYRLSRREGDPQDKDRRGRYWLYLTLHPKAERAEVLRGLYGGLLEAVGAFGARSAMTMAQEAMRARLEVLKTLGFEETLRSYGADLDVTAFDLSPYEGHEASLAAQGITICTLAELRNDPDHLERLYALYLETQRDIPEVGPSDTKTFEAFTTHLSSDDLLPKAFFVALSGRDYVGYSYLLAGDDELRQQETAVRRDVRRRGIALALKLRGLAYAQRSGASSINTGMASNNTAMVALNARLGFVPKPAWITFSKLLPRLGRERTPPTP